MVVSIVLMISLLSGCQQYLEDALGIINELLDGSSDEAEGEEAEDEEVDIEEDAEEVDQEESDGTEDGTEDGSEEDEKYVMMTVPDFVTVGDMILYEPEKVEPFDDRLRNQGYTVYKNPIGMPLDIPYQWVLVDGESEMGNFSGLYCFDMPIDSEQFNDFDYHHIGMNPQHNSNPDNEGVIHETKYNVGDEGHAVIQYGLDDHGNTCAQVDIDYENEIDKFVIDEIREFEPIDVDRKRSLPSYYDDVLARATSADNFHSIDGRNSVKDALYSGEKELLPLSKVGIPEIFLFDSYMVHEVDTGSGSDVNILMCTDIYPHIATDKHLELLGNYNANIEYFEIIPPEDNTSMLKVATMIDFSFNDEFGTGSWSGTSYFYRYEDDDSPFSEQSCMSTEMLFSTTIIK